MVNYINKEIELINKVIKDAIIHGGDAGGAYCQYGGKLKESIEKWLEYRGLTDRYAVEGDLDGFLTIEATVDEALVENESHSQQIACTHCGSVIKPFFDGDAEMRNEYSLLEDIRFELTNYENSTDTETTDTEWKDAFYDLLCRVVNAVECGEAVFEEPNFVCKESINNGKILGRLTK